MRNLIGINFIFFAPSKRPLFRTTSTSSQYSKFMAHHRKYSRFFPLVLVLSTLVTGGCMVEKPMVPPYEGRNERATARQYPVSKPDIRKTDESASLPANRRQDEPRLAEEDLLLPVLTRINDRIFSYEQKLARIKSLEADLAAMGGDQKRRDELAQCRNQIEDILDRYNALHQQFLQRDQVSSRELLSASTLLDLEKDDFSFLESKCNRIVTEKHPKRMLVGTDKELIEQRAEAIRKAFEQHDYRSVIAEYEQLVSFLPVPPAEELTLLYGKALMKSGQEDKARVVLEGLLNRLRRQDQAQWEFTLRQLIGDLNFALRRYEPAKKQYNKLVSEYERLSEHEEWARQQLAALNVADEQSAEVRAYADLLRSYLAYNPERDGYTVVRKGEEYLKKYPYSLVASSVDYLVNASRKAADAWYNNLLAKIDALAKEHKYQDALLLIEKVPRLILPVEKQQELADKARELRTIEAISRKSSQLAAEQQAQEDWNTGMTALAAREYDKAIDAFTRTLGTSYDARAREKIKEVANLAAREDRRRAAELFVRSGRTKDPRSRKKLLLASRQLLQDILIKYPQADLIDKVKRNLRRINQEIEAIDPDLLNTPVTVGGALQTSLAGDNQKDKNKPEETGQKRGIPPAQAVKSDTVRE